MKVRSKIEVLIQKDRTSELKGMIEIEIKQTKKDDANQTYTFETRDWVVNGITRTPILQLGNKSQQKIYTKTYAEYDGQKEQLSLAYPSVLTGSALDDYLLQMGLLYNLSIDPIYGLTGNDWEGVE